MENGEKLMTSEESLKIITEMINKTKVNIRNSSFHLLFWGWLIFICSLMEYILWKYTNISSPWFVWYFVIPGVFVSFIYGFTTGRKAKFHTYADKIYVWTWMAFLIASLVLFIILPRNMESVSSHILTLAAIPTFLSGFIIKFKPLVIGGITFWIFAVIAHFAGADLAALAVPVAMLTGYLIPGYLLKRRVDHEKV
jgi:hypothetical protein